MKETIVSKAIRLLCVKSLVTLALTAAFVYLAVVGKITPDMFMTIFTVVIAFYFGTQAKKNESTTV